MARDLTLFDSAISGNSYKCRLLLAQLGLPYKKVPVDILKGESRTPEFKAMNPFYRVPFLIDGDFKLGESNAILIWLARGSTLYPDDPKTQARIQEWMFFEQNQLEASVAVVRYVRTWAANDPTTPAIIEAQARRGPRSLQVLEDHLKSHDWLVGNAYSIADICLFGYTPLAPDAGWPLDPYPAIRAWIERVKHTPGFVPMQ
jgi:glutathione S-transferase